MRAHRLALLVVLCLSPLISAQSPLLAPSEIAPFLAAPTPPVATRTETAAAVSPVDGPLPNPLPLGQQHLFGLHLSIFQPTVVTAQMTLVRHNGVSYAAEVYAGSVLVELLYGV